MKRMYKKMLLGGALSLAGLTTQAQVKVGDNPTTLAPNTVFQVQKGGSSMVVSNSGMVGIGTTTPAAKLDIMEGSIRTAKSGDHSGIIATVATNDGAHPYMMQLRSRGTLSAQSYPNNGDILGAFIARDAIDGNTSINYGGAGVYLKAAQDFSSAQKGSKITFTTTPFGTNNDLERMTISHDGYVGLGTTTPGTKLDIMEGSIRTAKSGDHSGIVATVATNDASHPYVMQLRARGNLGTKWYPNNGDILGAFIARDALDGLTSTEYGGAGIFMKAAQDFSAAQKGTNIIFTTTGLGSNNDAGRMFIGADGNVGIGTASPDTKLVVVGNVTGNSFITASDRRFKQNVQPLSNALAMVGRMRGVTYTYTSKAIKERGVATGNQIGFIAQELEAIYPQFVVTGSDGYKAVDYARLTPVLVEAVKELSTEVAQLKAEKAKISARVSEIDNLKAEMASIKAMLQQQAVATPLNSGK